MTLIEALQNIDIQLVPGRVYHLEVDGYEVELRVREGKPRREPLDLQDDTMLDAGVEFPDPPAKPVQDIIHIDPPLPDVPCFNAAVNPR